MDNDNNNNQPIKVCAAVIQHQYKVLLTLRPEDKQLGGYWEFPGGKIESGETPQFALERELREELNIEIEVGTLLETVSHRYEWGNVLIYAYLCTWKSGEIKHLEVTDHCWVSPANLLNYAILAADLPIVKKLLNNISKGVSHEHLPDGSL